MRQSPRPKAKACSPTSLRRSQAGELVDGDDRQEQQDDDGEGLGLMVAADRQAQHLADAAAADRADDGRGAHVDLERAAARSSGSSAAPAARCRTRRARPSWRRPRAGLRRASCRRSRPPRRTSCRARRRCGCATATIAGDRPEREDRQEEAGDHDLGKGAQDFQEAAHEEAQPALRRSMLRAAKKQSTKPKAKPISVETSAMLIVSSIL